MGLESGLNLDLNRLKAVGYDITKMNRELDNTLISKTSLDEKIYSSFNIRDRISNVDLKEKLKSIYEQLKLNKKAKGSDISSWFRIKPVTIILENGKRVNGVEIIDKL